MKNDKATGPDLIPRGVWKAQGKEEVEITEKLTENVYIYLQEMDELTNRYFNGRVNNEINKKKHKNKTQKNGV